MSLFGLVCLYTTSVSIWAVIYGVACTQCELLGAWQHYFRVRNNCWTKTIVFFISRVNSWRSEVKKRSNKSHNVRLLFLGFGFGKGIHLIESFAILKTCQFMHGLNKVDEPLVSMPNAFVLMEEGRGEQRKKLVHSTNRFKRAQAKKRSGNCFFHYLAQINSFNFSRFVHQKYPHIMLVKKVEKTTIHLTEALQDSSTFWF